MLFLRRIQCGLLGGMLLLAACTPTAAPTATLAPTLTPSPVATRTPLVLPTLTATATAAPAVTPSATPVLIDSYTGIGYEPPFDITLPEGWKAAYNTAIVPEMGELAPIPLAIYQGPVTGGTGTIALLWNFRSITTGNPLDPAAGQVNLWIDGLRYLRLLVVEIGCNVGTADQRNDFMVAGQPATGTIWSAVDCPELPDTRGWFAGLDAYGMSFVFYAFGDPITVMDGAAVQEMQAILDSIRFRTAQ